MNKLVEFQAEQIFITLPDEALIKLPTILLLFNVSKSTWYREIKIGRYPKPVKQGRSSRWVLGELKAALAALKDSR